MVSYLHVAMGPGDIIADRYRIVSKLGEGGMGSVWLAEHQALGAAVAVKLIDPDIADDPSSLARFVREARSAAQLRSPYVVQIHDYGVDNGTPYIVMERLEGETLADRLDRTGTLTPLETTIVITQVARAVERAHAAGIVHRDLKPDNIFILQEQELFVKVLDFGVAKVQVAEEADPSLTSTGALLGTPYFMSPEQVNGSKDLDHRTDLWSLGVIAFNCLTGMVPFQGHGLGRLMVEICRDPLPVPSEIATLPDGFDEWFARALERDPNARFQTARELSEALNEVLAPGHQLDAHETIRTRFSADGGANDLNAPTLPGKQSLAALGNLPEPSTHLFGRAEAIAEVESLLSPKRLVTLLGVGGLGKTRLAIETAKRVAPYFPDGTWFVDLAAVGDANAVAAAAAGVFGVKQQSDKSITESLVDALGARRLLLILDNCEHVTAAAAELAAAVLAGCPEVKVIATSRELLAIADEQVWAIPPLAFAGASAPAVQLFVERASAIAPNFELGTEGEVVSQICQELDGIPLAIELAAARVRSLTPAQILARISERFRLLTGGSRATAQGRHQTLRNTVQWSFDLLTATEQTVLRRVSVFAGGFSLEGAEEVCSDDEIDALDVCDALDSLVSKSLLQVTRKGALVRFEMLRTIRSFGEERLKETGESEAVRRRHAVFFAKQSAMYFELWRSPRERDAYEWLDSEINNLREAFRWALDNDDLDSAAQIASDVGDMGRFRLREEAANWAEEVVERARAAKHRRLVVLLTWSASSAWAFSRFEDAQRFGEEALALLDDPAYDPFVWAYGDLAFVAIFGGDIPKAIELLRLGSEHPTDRHDRFMLAFHLFIMATAGYADDAAKIANDVVQKVESAGVPMSISIAYGAKGAALESTDAAGALAAYERGVQIARQAGARFMETLIAPRIAALHARSGEPLEALRGFERMLSSFGEATDVASVSAWRASLVVLLAKLGHHEGAATLHGTFADSIDASGVVAEHAAAVQQLTKEMGESAFADAAALGAAMSLREATNFAIRQVRIGLGQLQRTGDQHDTASQIRARTDARGVNTGS